MQRILIASSVAALLATATGCKDKAEESTEPTANPATAPEAGEGPIVFAAGAEPAVHVRTGLAGYEIPAAQKHGDDCAAGNIPREPQLELVIEEEQRLRVVVAGEVDLTLVLEGPEDSICVDDGRGNDPVTSFTATPGTYRIYVGTFEDEPWDPTPEFELKIGPVNLINNDNAFVQILRSRLEQMENAAEDDPQRLQQLEEMRTLVGMLGGDEDAAAEVSERIGEMIQSDPMLRSQIERMVEEHEELRAITDQVDAANAANGQDAPPEAPEETESPETSP